jgi:hypothetical protein
VKDDTSTLFFFFSFSYSFIHTAAGSALIKKNIHFIMHLPTLISTAVFTLACTTGLVQAAPIQARGDQSLYGIT